ncbi:hypothetical protein AtNW77_Chr1g0024221 [Arabidopsis thaliana]|uniref:Transmembrane protein n=1 Tax=Arabidopsis thaliana TaxID=3702 RepID=A0A178W5P6_ARATH|nr:hypothetical protein AXX17_AT1G22640 [Arabidopsis thaliana]
MKDVIEGLAGQELDGRSITVIMAQLRGSGRGSEDTAAVVAVTREKVVVAMELVVVTQEEVVVAVEAKEDTAAVLAVTQEVVVVAAEAKEDTAAVLAVRRIWWWSRRKRRWRMVIPYWFCLIWVLCVVFGFTFATLDVTGRVIKFDIWKRNGKSLFLV